MFLKDLYMDIAIRFNYANVVSFYGLFLFDPITLKLKLAFELNL